MRPKGQHIPEEAVVVRVLEDATYGRYGDNGHWIDLQLEPGLYYGVVSSEQHRDRAVIYNTDEHDNRIATVDGKLMVASIEYYALSPLELLAEACDGP